MLAAAAAKLLITHDVKRMLYPLPCLAMYPCGYSGSSHVAIVAT